MHDDAPDRGLHHGRDLFWRERTVAGDHALQEPFSGFEGPGVRKTRLTLQCLAAIRNAGAQAAERALQSQWRTYRAL